MNSFFKKYKYHLLIIIVGLVWISFFDFLIQMSCQGVMHSDSFNYQEASKNLYVFFSGHNYRPILMSMLYGNPYVFGSSDAFIFTFGFYINILCWLTFSILLFEILKEFIKPKIAFIFTILSFFIVGNTAHVFHLLTETIYMLFIIVAFYFLLKYYKKQQYSWLSLSLSVFLLVMLIKPGSVYLTLVLVFFFLKIIFKNYKNKANWILCGCLFMVFIQCSGMLYQFGNFTISYIDAPTYYGYIGSKAMCIKNGKEYRQENNPRADYIYSLEAKKQKEIASKDLMNQLQFNTINLFKAYISDLLDNTKSGNSCIYECKNLRNINQSFFDFSKKMIFHISKWQNRFYTLFGVFLSLFFLLKTYIRPNLLTFISFFILYTYILSGISCGQGDRFHLVTFPFVILLLAKFLRDKNWIKPIFEPLQR